MCHLSDQERADLYLVSVDCLALTVLREHGLVHAADGELVLNLWLRLLYFGKQVSRMNRRRNKLEAVALFARAAWSHSDRLGRDQDPYSPAGHPAAFAGCRNRGTADRARIYRVQEGRKQRVDCELNFDAIGKC